MTEAIIMFALTFMILSIFIVSGCMKLNKEIDEEIERQENIEARFKDKENSLIREAIKGKERLDLK